MQRARNSTEQSATVLTWKLGVRFPPGVLHPCNPDFSMRGKSKGYFVVYCPNHPFCWSNGYIYEHRIVAEIRERRLLGPKEHVHHEDENRGNNKPSNLKIKSPSKHARDHAKKGLSMCEMRCPVCKQVFSRPKGNTHLSKQKKFGCTCCSSSCRGRLSTRPQDYDTSCNVIKEFKV